MADILGEKLMTIYKAQYREMERKIEELQSWRNVMPLATETTDDGFDKWTYLVCPRCGTDKVVEDQEWCGECGQHLAPPLEVDLDGRY